MRYSSNPVKISCVLLGLCILLTILQVGAPKRTSSQSAPEAAQKKVIPPCGAASSTVLGEPPSQASPTPHSVTLSWIASIPKSNSKPDAIQGYYVYRSLKSQTYTESNRISSSPVQGTQCVDTAVEPRKTYYYVVKAVAQSGEKSNFSNETKAVIPFP